MKSASSARDPWIIRAGRWLTKRRGIILASLFAVAFLAARKAENPWVELGQDLLGIFCLIVGTWLRLVAASYHESSHRLEPITAGPYAWVRHPLYLANFLMGLGIVIMAGWWPMVAVYLLIFLPIHTLIARSEEVHLARLYGEKYEVYRRQVPAILPWRRFRGPFYGSRNSFKLKKGSEGLKIFGYTAGIIALLALKRWRHAVRMPVLRPLPILSGVLLAAIALLAVIYRPRIRLAWLRACQTVLATAAVLFLALHAPGVWSPPRSPQFVSSPIPLSHSPISQKPPGFQPEDSTLGDSAAPAVVPTDATMPSATTTPQIGNRSMKPEPSETFLRGFGSFLWNHLELAGGAATMGIGTLVEDEREEHNGKAFQPDEDLAEVGQVAMGVAVALSLWKQWHQTPATALTSSDREPWQFQVRPVLDDDRKIALWASFKRRF